MEQKVLIPSDISQPGKDYLRERGYVIKMGRGIDEQTIMEDAADCDALLARNEHITRGIMEAAPHLKVISKHPPRQGFRGPAEALLRLIETA